MLIDRLLHIMLMASPLWNDTIGAYSLDFGGRVLLPSVMNFQLATASAAAAARAEAASTEDPHDDDDRAPRPQQHNPTVLLQFGRVSDHEFTLDFKRPLNLVQAVHCLVSARDHGTVAGAGMGAVLRVLGGR